MNKLQYLLVCLNEECSEVQKLISKSLRFGIDDCEPNMSPVKDNGCKLQEEMNDIFALCEMLRDETGFNPCPSRILMDAKKEKVKKYMKYSIERGKLDK